jgi:hypothetical protein
MINTEKVSESKPEIPQEPVDKPDEHGGLLVQGFFKITDPESGTVIVQGRA